MCGVSGGEKGSGWEWSGVVPEVWASSLREFKFEGLLWSHMVSAAEKGVWDAERGGRRSVCVR